MESRKRLWIGYAISGTLLLFLLFDSVGKLLKVTPVLEGSAYIGVLIWLALCLRNEKLRRFLSV